MEKYNAGGINKTLDKVQKVISTTTAGGVAGLSTNVLVRENLSGIITRLPYRKTNVRDRLSRKPGAGLAAAWNVLSGITAGNSAFVEGATPTENNATYARRTAAYKELGKSKSITDRMMAAGKSFADQDAEQTEVAMREVVQDEEQLIITGDATGTPTEFDGLVNYVTTNVTNDANNALGFRESLIQDEVANIMLTYGVMPTAVYVGYGMKNAIDNSLQGVVNVNLNSGNEVATGVDVNFIQTMAGKLPIIPTFAIAADTTTYAGFTVEDIYIVTERTERGDVLYMEDLYPLGKTYLARTGAAINFMVTEATVLVCRAEEMMARVRNVRVA